MFYMCVVPARDMGEQFHVRKETEMSLTATIITSENVKYVRGSGNGWQIGDCDFIAYRKNNWKMYDLVAKKLKMALSLFESIQIQGPFGPNGEWAHCSGTVFFYDSTVKQFWITLEEVDM